MQDRSEHHRKKLIEKKKAQLLEMKCTTEHHDNRHDQSEEKISGLEDTKGVLDDSIFLETKEIMRA